MSKHAPTPWTEFTTPKIEVGQSHVLIGGGPPLVDCRIISEKNFQLAKKCVNAHDELMECIKGIDRIKDILCHSGTIKKEHEGEAQAVDFMLYTVKQLIEKDGRKMEDIIKALKFYESEEDLYEEDFDHEECIEDIHRIYGKEIAEQIDSRQLSKIRK